MDKIVCYHYPDVALIMMMLDLFYLNDKPRKSHSFNLCYVCLLNPAASIQFNRGIQNTARDFVPLNAFLFRLNCHTPYVDQI